MSRDMAGLVEALTAFHARPGRGSRTNILPLCPSLLQSARPYGCYRCWGGVVLPLAMFQPTRPHRARPPATRPRMSGRPFQPTRPHRARRVAGACPGRGIRVSTHAPAQGATDLLRSNLNNLMFQPTRPHRARRHLYKPAPLQPFLPRIREPRPTDPQPARPVRHPVKIPFALNHLPPREPQADKPVTPGSQRPAKRRKEKRSGRRPQGAGVFGW